MQFIFKITVTTLEDTALFECLEIVANEIGNDWQRLARILKLPLDGTCQENTSFDNIMRCFENADFLISWKQLKRCLLRLGKDVIIRNS